MARKRFRYEGSALQKSREMKRIHDYYRARDEAMRPSLFGFLRKR